MNGLEAYSICVVVPCYNEARRLNHASFQDYVAQNRDVCFIFVDDGSTDQTAELLVRLCMNAPDQLHTLRLKQNKGKAEAVRQGVMAAIHSGVRRIAYWDADLATPLSAIKQLSRQLDAEGITTVIGSRVKLLGRKIERHVGRHYLGRIFATCASTILRLPVYDTQCGAKMFENNRELEMAFSRPFQTKWIFDVELIARLDNAKRKLIRPLFLHSTIEFPLEEWVDVSGSKVKIWDFFIAAIDLIKIAVYRLDA